MVLVLNIKSSVDKSQFNVFPNLRIEWDYQSNTIDPKKLTYGSGKKVLWICSSCNMRFESTVNNRTKGRGCPYCSNKKVRDGMSLKDEYKELVKEWHKRNLLSPSEVSSKSSKRVYWECKSCKFIWMARIYNRTVRGSGCPKCARNKQKKANNKC